MKNIKIGYAHWYEKNNLYSEIEPAFNYTWMDILNFDLEKLDTWKDSKSNFTRCPAFVHYIDQFWVLRSTIDVKLIWDDRKKILTSDLNPTAHSMMIKSHDGDFNPYVGLPIAAINNPLLFFSDEDVWIEWMPAFNDIQPSWRLIPGSFNIHNWQRPVVPSFEMLENEVVFKRGQPIAYIKFRSKNPRDTFKLVKHDRTADLEKLVMGCTSMKFFQKNLSWKVITGLIPNKLRPRKLLK